MDTRFILLILLTITSCLTVKVNSGENEEQSWTQSLRGRREVNSLQQNSGRDESNYHQRVQPRYVSNNQIGSSQSPRSRTDDLTSNSHQMSLSHALQLLMENQGSNGQRQSSKQENQNSQNIRKERRTRHRRQHRNVLQDQPRRELGRNSSRYKSN